MTSGTFTSFPISSIWVDREKRQRRELVGVPELASSIREVGLINPITVRRSGELVAGERRFEAVKSLGWTNVIVQFLEDMSDDQVYLIELEENVKRVDLSWQDRAEAVRRYHELRAKNNPDWSSTKTAEALNVSVVTVSENLKVAEAVRNDENIAAMPKMKTALNVIRRKQERAAADIENFVLTGKTEDRAKPPLLNADFIEWQKTYDGPKFNLIHCDFPYGVGADRSAQNSGTKVYGTYSDKKSDYWNLVKSLGLATKNVIAESAHLIFWFDMNDYAPTKVSLTNAGWSVLPFPLIWYKNDNTGILSDSERRPRHIYETALFATRGDRKITQAVSDCFGHPGRDKEIHMSEKPTEMLRYFLRMVVDESTSIFDPTCGSANALRVAKHLGAKRILGIEKDETFFKDASARFFDPI